MRKINANDKFKLGGFEWVVTGREEEESGKLMGFYATRFRHDLPQTDTGEYFDREEIVTLDWLKPEVKKLTKEQGDMVKEQFKQWCIRANEMEDTFLTYLDSITE